jgi:hypothetical protein
MIHMAIPWRALNTSGAKKASPPSLSGIDYVVNSFPKCSGSLLAAFTAIQVITGMNFIASAGRFTAAG